MKGVILAGGIGERLRPLTNVTNKHLLPVGKEPMLYHPIRKFVEAGISDILIVTGVEHIDDIVTLLGSGREFSNYDRGLKCQFTYKVQDELYNETDQAVPLRARKELGIAQALSLAENFANGSSLAVLLGDNIFQDSLKLYMDNFIKQKKGARILLKQVIDPSRFGVPAFDNGLMTAIEEKPSKPASNYAVTGIYFYDNQVFDLIRSLKPSSRGQLEITDVHNLYLQKQALEYDILPGWWTDASTFESYHYANRLVFESEESQPAEE